MFVIILGLRPRGDGGMNSDWVVLEPGGEGLVTLFFFFFSNFCHVFGYWIGRILFVYSSTSLFFFFWVNLRIALTLPARNIDWRSLLHHLSLAGSKLNIPFHMCRPILYHSFTLQAPSSLHSFRTSPSVHFSALPLILPLACRWALSPPADQ